MGSIRCFAALSFRKRGEYIALWIKGITRRWLFNVLGIVVLVLVVLIVSLSFAVQNYTYNGILQALNANSEN